MRLRKNWSQINDLRKIAEKKKREMDGLQRWRETHKVPTGLFRILAEGVAATMIHPVSLIFHLTQICHIK